MKAWLFQDTRQKQKLRDKAPWSVGWFDPDGKKRSKRIGLKYAAEKYRRRIEGELAAGTYNSHHRKTWEQFWTEYQEKVLDAADWGHRKETKLAVKAFERIAKPKRLSGIKMQMIDDFRTKRAQEARKGHDTKVSPATVNKELRHLKLVLNRAVDWGYLPKLPKVRMLREPEKLKRYVSPEDFAVIYNACDTATQPMGFPFQSVDWWRGLLVFAYMTGWRIGEILALRREDVDMEAATAITRHSDNKGKRDDLVPVNAAVVDHLRKVPSFEPVVSPSADSLQAVPRHPGRRGDPGRLLRFSRSASRIRDTERVAAVRRRTAGDDATPVLRNDQAIHQYGKAAEPDSGESVRAGRAG